ncbi:uncharacterized protein LOC105661825 [Megachile rotundata]|uniref:uncharacterized protein LOC105661825 n=1 Tax=Megachile rotundata TaxID=143995 RepID=UPI003FD30C33
MHDKPITEQTDPEILSDYSLQLNRWLLKSIGAWPKSSSTTKTELTVSLILTVIGYTTILITVIPAILQLILGDIDLHTKVVLVGPMSHWCLGGIGYTMLLMHDEEIKWCVERVKNDWRSIMNPEMQQTMIKNAKLSRYVVSLCAILMQSAVLGFGVEKALSTQVITVGNETKVVHMLPCATYRKLLPVDTSPTFEIVLVAQFVSGFFVNGTFAGAFSLASAFTLHAYSQLNILATWITEAVDQSSLNDVGAIVRKHLAILSFISRIEAIMNEICFMELFKCTFSICLLGFNIILVR